MTVCGVLEKIVGFFKKNWVNILLPLLSFLLGLFVMEYCSEEPSPNFPHKELEEIDDRTREEQDRIREEYEQRIADLEERHAETIQNLTEEQGERYNLLRKDPEQLNEYLNELVGSDMSDRLIPPNNPPVLQPSEGTGIGEQLDDWFTRTFTLP